MESVPSYVVVIWWIALLVTAVAVLPLAVHLLNRTLIAARQIEQNLAEARDAALGIQNNTAEVSQLTTTLETAPTLLNSGENIERGSEALRETMSSRLGGGEP